MNNKFLLLTLLGTFIIIVFGVVVLSKSSSPPLPLPVSYEYFWGEGCPHCANVDDFLETWDKKDQIQVEKKEVYQNKENANYLAQRAAYCKLNTNNIGIPFLFTPEGECLTGDEPIIEFFKSLK
jgi:glutaredoxin